MSQAYDIKWEPNVCNCIILQDRLDPEQFYQFSTKCEIHIGMNDVDARANIIEMCIAASGEE
jgi:hypothetical protein